MVTHIGLGRHRHMMTTPHTHDVRDRFADARISPEHYQLHYAESVASPETYWGHCALQTLDWHRPFARVKNTSFTKERVSIK
jgi:hypothetical protein